MFFLDADTFSRWVPFSVFVLEVDSDIDESFSFERIDGEGGSVSWLDLEGGNKFSMFCGVH